MPASTTGMPFLGPVPTNPVPIVTRKGTFRRSGNVIFLSALITATNTDVLSGTRLDSIPFGGILVMRFQSNLANASNNYSLTIQEPNGNVPVDSQLVPGNNPALDGVMDERTLFQMSLPASQGGHFIVSLTETGTAAVMYQMLLRPA